MSKAGKKGGRKIVVFSVPFVNEVFAYLASFAVFFGVWFATRITGVAFLTALVFLVVVRDVGSVVIRHFAVGGYALFLASFILEASEPSTGMFRSPQFLLIVIGAVICGLIDSYGTRFVRWRSLSLLFWASGRALVEWVPGLFKEFWTFLATGVVMVIYGVVFNSVFVGVAGVFVVAYMPVSLWVRAIRRSASAVYHSLLGVSDPYEDALKSELRDSYWKTLIRYEADYGVYAAYALAMFALLGTRFLNVSGWVVYGLVAVVGVYLLYEGVKAWAWRAVERVGVPAGFAVVIALLAFGALLFGGFPGGVMVSCAVLWGLALGYPAFRRYWLEVSAALAGKPFLVTEPRTDLLKAVQAQEKVKSDEWVEFVTRPLSLVWGVVLSLFAVFPVFAALFGYSWLTVCLVYGVTVLFAWCLMKQLGFSSVYLPVLATVYALSSFTVWFFL